MQIFTGATKSADKRVLQAACKKSSLFVFNARNAYDFISQLSREFLNYVIFVNVKAVETNHPTDTCGLITFALLCCGLVDVN